MVATRPIVNFWPDGSTSPWNYRCFFMYQTVPTSGADRYPCRTTVNTTLVDLISFL
jgi:hypothetical protein